MKPKVFFVVKYIGTLKYYEKLFPFLSEKFDLTFLLLTDRGMVSYCQEEGHRFVQLPLRKRRRLPIPFLAHVRDQSFFIDQVERFLDTEKPVRLVGVPSANFHGYALFDAANAQGIDTVALQWALHIYKDKENAKERRRQNRSWYADIRTLYFKLLVKLLTFNYRRVTGREYVDGAQAAAHIAIFDDRAEAYFEDLGYPSDKYIQVGNLDVALMRRLKDEVDSSSERRAELLARYGIPAGKKIILVISTFFYLGKTVKFTDEAGQREYYRKVFESIRASYADDEAVILFKLHPKESDIYGECYQDLGVLVFSKQAKTDELVALADLYIVHPETSTNYLMIGADVPAIIINMTPLHFLDRAKDIYGITHIVKEWNELREYVALFKAGTLPRQYKPSSAYKNSLEKHIAVLVGEK